MSAYIVGKLIAFLRAQQSLEKSTEEGDLKHLYDYLDDQLAVLYDNLYPKLFKKVLQSLWRGIVEDLRSALLPTIENKNRVSMDIQRAKDLSAVLEELVEYFYCDGNGLDREYIKQQETTLRKILTLCELPTSELIKKYKEACAPEYKDEDVKAAGTYFYSISYMC
jgi:hypothetical protein